MMVALFGWFNIDVSSQLPEPATVCASVIVSPFTRNLACSSTLHRLLDVMQALQKAQDENARLKAFGRTQITK